MPPANGSLKKGLEECYDWSKDVYAGPRGEEKLKSINTEGNASKLGGDAQFAVLLPLKVFHL